MFTPQEVEERVFPKVKKGGYDMKDVDDFLDQLTADYTELYKENAVLKRKMKVLADKITEYQETEGAMRQTLLAAQKMADQITGEAQAKRDAMLAEAERIASAKSQELAAQVAEQEEALKRAKRSVAEMTANIRALLAQEQEFLDNLPDMDADSAAPAEPAADAVAAEIGDSIGRMMAEEPAVKAAPVTPAAPAEEAPAKPAAAEVPAEEPAAEEAPAGEPEEEPASPALPQHRDDEIDDAPTRRLDLSELRFGRNYEIK